MGGGDSGKWFAIEIGGFSGGIAGFGGLGGRFRLPAVGEFVELGTDVGWSVEFDADVTRRPPAVMAVEDPRTVFDRPVDGADGQLREADRAVEAVARASGKGVQFSPCPGKGVSLTYLLPSLLTAELGVSNKQLVQKCETCSSTMHRGHFRSWHSSQ